MFVVADALRIIFERIEIIGTQRITCDHKFCAACRNRISDIEIMRLGIFTAYIDLSVLGLRGRNFGLCSRCRLEYPCQVDLIVICEYSDRVFALCYVLAVLRLENKVVTVLIVFKILFIDRSYRQKLRMFDIKITEDVLCLILQCIRCRQRADKHRYGYSRKYGRDDVEREFLSE